MDGDIDIEIYGGRKRDDTPQHIVSTIEDRVETETRTSQNPTIGCCKAHPRKKNTYIKQTNNLHIYIYMQRGNFFINNTVVTTKYLVSKGFDAAPPFHDGTARVPTIYIWFLFARSLADQAS
jgi:hypothetical protein